MPIKQYENYENYEILIELERELIENLFESLDHAKFLAIH